jgi:hypothetical protein
VVEAQCWEFYASPCTAGRRGPGERDVRHVCALRRHGGTPRSLAAQLYLKLFFPFLTRNWPDFPGRIRAGRDGVLGAVGAPGAMARLPVAHARVAPPAARGLLTELIRN